jgi:hypothetical protein
MDFDRLFPAIILPIVIVCLVVLRHHDKRKQHRSTMQVLIRFVYFVLRLMYAFARGFDVGYLEYRRVLREEPAPVIENELHLGKAVGQALGEC